MTTESTSAFGVADAVRIARPRRVAALRSRNEALAAELRVVAAQFLAEADELEAKPGRLVAKYTEAIEALGGTEEVATWWADTP